MVELITRLWHLHFRLILSTALGTAVTLALLAVPWRAPTRILLGWDAGVVLYLALIYAIMANASIAKIRQRAAIVDEGALAVLVLTTAAALASLVAVLAELGLATPNPRIVDQYVGLDRATVTSAAAWSSPLSETSAFTPPTTGCTWCGKQMSASKFH
jgi:uncharacterized membrane protein